MYIRPVDQIIFELAGHVRVVWLVFIGSNIVRSVGSNLGVVTFENYQLEGQW